MRFLFVDAGPITLKVLLRIVGVFTPKPGDGFWHGETFEPIQLGVDFNGYTALLSNEAFLNIFVQGTTSGLVFLDQPELFWYYRLDASQIKADQLDDLIARLSSTQTQLPLKYAGTDYLSVTELSGPLLESSKSQSNLERYRDRISVVQIPVNLLLLQVSGPFARNSIIS